MDFKLGVRMKAKAVLSLLETGPREGEDLGWPLTDGNRDTSALDEEIDFRLQESTTEVTNLRTFSRK